MRTSACNDLEYDKERDRDKERKGRESCFDCTSEASSFPSSCEREDRD